MRKGLATFLSILASFVLVFSLSGAISAQGKSGNKGKKKTNINSGKSTDTENRGKSADKRTSNKSDRDDSDSRNRDDYDDDNNRYRGNDRRWKNDKRGDRYNDEDYRAQGKSNRFRGLSKKIGMSPEDAQDWYEREKDRNPSLTYGQFVAANMVARKNNSSHPRITTERILDRLGDGQNFGQAVKDLGLKGDKYESERRRIRRELEAGGYNARDGRNRDDRYDYRTGW